MKRRAFIQLLVAASLAPAEALATIPQFDGGGSKKLVRPAGNDQIAVDEDDVATDSDHNNAGQQRQGQEPQRDNATADSGHSNATTSGDTLVNEENIKDYLSKIRAPNTPHHDDIYASAQDVQTLRQVADRFRRIVARVGDANFCVMGFDETLDFAKTTAKVEPFAKDEIDLMVQLFARNARDYGFYGEKPVTSLSAVINQHDIYKVPYSGNFLFRGKSLEKFIRIRKDLGENLILTSGIRSVVKQFYLFINKALRFDGNLSLASRSLAPPGYSYHATGDFDVGQRGFGPGNFTEDFIGTPIYKRLSKEGYVQYRYGRDNLLGVRFEPWHIKL
ncbi:MAG: M15 family metallopeptidase [Desulfobulbaceae bacterium]|nr:M15 family metallopeptidase [Desulfobulbaceae bacterium]